MTSRCYYTGLKLICLVQKLCYQAGTEQKPDQRLRKCRPKFSFFYKYIIICYDLCNQVRVPAPRLLNRGCISLPDVAVKSRRGAAGVGASSWSVGARACSWRWGVDNIGHGRRSRLSMPHGHSSRGGACTGCLRPGT